MPRSAMRRVRAVDDGAGLVGVGVDLAAGFDVGGTPRRWKSHGRAWLRGGGGRGRGSGRFAELGDKGFGGAALVKLQRPPPQRGLNAGGGRFFSKSAIWGAGGAGGRGALNLLGVGWQYRRQAGGYMRFRRRRWRPSLPAAPPPRMARSKSRRSFLLGIA